MPIPALAAQNCAWSKNSDPVSANRRRHINALPAIKLFMCFIAGAFLLLSGLGYVHCQNQLHHASDETGKLEKELQRLRTLSDVARVNIAKLSSHKALLEKWDNGFFKPLYVRIPDDRINRVSALLKTPAEEAQALRPVANERAAP